MSQKELDVLLIGEQVDRDTARADLDNGDAAAVGNDFSLEFNQASNAISVTTSSFGKHPNVPGMAEIDFKAYSYLSDNGSSAPMFEPLLKSCGFKLGQAGDVRTYTPSSLQSDWTYLSAWKYTGVKTTGESLITKAFSILCDGTIEGSIGEPLKLTCTGKGAADGIPELGNYVSGTIALPVDTIPVMLKASAMQAMGFNYDILKVSIAFKNSVANIKEVDDAFPFGYRYADIANRDFEVKLTVYQNTDTPYPAMTAGTLGTFTIVLGATGAKVHVYCPLNKLQITDVKSGASEGQDTWELTAKIAYDDFAVKTGE